VFSKDDVNKAIEVIKEEIDFIKMTEPSATNELDMLEFAIVSLEGYRDRDSTMAMLREQELLASVR
jgi:prefoldin subunit 5